MSEHRSVLEIDDEIDVGRRARDAMDGAGDGAANMVRHATRFKRLNDRQHHGREDVSMVIGRRRARSARTCSREFGP